MSKPLADTNIVAPAPVVAETEKEDVPPNSSATVIDELPNGYDSSENIKVSWFRGTLFQTLIVGMASFLAPGAYAALAATGAGGLANVEIGNASVALAYALIVPSALVATGCMSKLGNRWTLAIGAAGYIFYSCALFHNSKTGQQPFLLIGAIICGATSGLFWVSEGAIIMLYSEPGRKGKLLALWQSLYQLATTMGGAINLALNVNLDQRGGLRPNTYLVFIGLNALAPIVSMFLSNPKQVQRKDGRAVPPFPDQGFWRETWLTICELKDPRIIACCFLWSQSLFVPSWLSTYLARHFTVRVRAMSSLVKPVMSIIWFQIMGLFLDNKKISIRWKLIGTWGFLQVVGFACTIWLVVIQTRQDAMEVSPSWDWTTPGFAAAWVPVVVATAYQATSYGYYYYMAGYSFPREAKGIRMARIIATLRSAESGSAAIAFGINATKYSLAKTGYINLAFLIVCLFCGIYVLQYVWVQDTKGAFNEPAQEAQVHETVVELGETDGKKK